MQRWEAQITGAAAIAAVSSFVTWAYLSMQAPFQVPSSSSLTEGLSGTWDDLSRELDRRVKARFPVGSSENQLASELKHQGFEKVDWVSSVEDEHEAIRNESRFPCGRVYAYVYWRADKEHRLTVVRGNYPMGDCL